MLVVRTVAAKIARATTPVSFVPSAMPAAMPARMSSSKRSSDGAPVPVVPSKGENRRREKAEDEERRREKTRHQDQVDVGGVCLRQHDRTEREQRAGDERVSP